MMECNETENVKLILYKEGKRQQTEPLLEQPAEIDGGGGDSSSSSSSSSSKWRI